MRHLTWDELWDLLEGEVPSRLPLWEAHLSTCPECLAKLSQVRAANQAVVRALQLPSESEEASQAWAQRFLAALPDPHTVGTGEAGVRTAPSRADGACAHGVEDAVARTPGVAGCASPVAGAGEDTTGVVRAGAGQMSRPGPLTETASLSTPADRQEAGWLRGRVFLSPRLLRYAGYAVAASAAVVAAVWANHVSIGPMAGPSSAPRQEESRVTGHASASLNSAPVSSSAIQTSVSAPMAKQQRESASQAAAPSMTPSGELAARSSSVMTLGTPTGPQGSAASPPISAASAMTSVDDIGPFRLWAVVRSASGAPVPGAYVALVADGKVVANGQTDATGKTPELVIPSLPADPVLGPSFDGQHPPFATVTAVGWKAGMRPSVVFPVALFPQTRAHASAGQVQITLRPAGQGVGVVDQGYRMLYAGHYLSWVEQQASQWNASDSVKRVQLRGAGVWNHGGHLLRVHVTDQSAHPVAQATIAAVVDGQITALVQSGSDGTASLPVPAADVDPRIYCAAFQGQSEPQTVTLVAFKPGYAGWVDFYQAVPAEGADVQIRLEAVQWRDANGWHQRTAPVILASEPSQPDLQKFTDWLRQQGR